MIGARDRKKASRFAPGRVFSRGAIPGVPPFWFTFGDPAGRGLSCLRHSGADKEASHLFLIVRSLRPRPGTKGRSC